MSSRKSLICLIVSLFVIICYLGIIACLVHLIPLPKAVKNLEDFEVETIFKIVFLWVLFFFLVVKALKENSNCPARYQIKSIQKSWQERIQALLKVNQEFGQLLLDHYNEDPKYSPFYSAVKSADMEFIRLVLNCTIVHNCA